MPPLPSVTDLFNKFAGREVLSPVALGIDRTVEEMLKVARDNGLQLHLSYPGLQSSAEIHPNTVTVQIERGADSRFRVSNKFKLG